MEREIARKIRAEVTRGVKKESDVVYLLVQIRKLMDISNSRQQYESLRMYSDWVVHIELNGPTAIKIVQKAEEYLPTILHARLTEEQRKEFERLFSLEVFHEELNSFLDANRIPMLSDAAWR